MAMIGSPRRVDGISFQVSADGVVSSIVPRLDKTGFAGATSSLVRSSALTDTFSSHDQHRSSS
jgi:hypothetical protein